MLALELEVIKNQSWADVLSYEHKEAKAARLVREGRNRCREESEGETRGPW